MLFHFLKKFFEKINNYCSHTYSAVKAMKKKTVAFVVLFLSLALLSSMVYAVIPPATLETQPPADASDCYSSIESSTAVGWIDNSYVAVSFNDTEELASVTFYRAASKVLTIDFDQSYLNVSEIEQPTPDEIPLVFYKLQWLNFTDSGWEEWTEQNPIPDNYFAYCQQIIVRALWQDDLVDPWYILAGTFVIYRGMPWVQIAWQVTNLFGGPRIIEFVPCGIFYLPSNRTILSSDLSAWNESTGLTYGNAWANDTRFTVGFTAVDFSGGTSIQLFDGTQDNLAPETYRAINGHSAAANWTQSFSTLPYQYNYTFILNSTNTIKQWCTAELWTPQDVDSVAFYYSTDKGVTWHAGLSYNFTEEEGTDNGFKTMGNNAVNATIYELCSADFYHLFPSVSPVISTPNADPNDYWMTSLLGVYDRVAFGVELPNDTATSACYVKAQVTFTGAARFYFEYSRRLPFDTKPEQDYNLVNQTDGELYFMTANSSSAPAWGIGMGQYLSHLRVTNYANGSLQNVLFSWSQTLDDEESAMFAMSVLGFPSINTNSHSIFNLSSDTPRFQIHEGYILTMFSPLTTYLDSGNRRIYILNWTQELFATPWESTGNYTVALVEHDRATNGWAPLTSPTWLFRRSSSPIVDVLDSSALTGIAFYLTTSGESGTPPGITTGEPTPTPTTTTPSLSILPNVADTDLILLAIAIVAVVVLVLAIVRKRV